MTAKSALQQTIELHTPIHVCPYMATSASKPSVRYTGETDFAADEKGYEPCPTYLFLKDLK